MKKQSLISESQHTLNKDGQLFNEGTVLKESRLLWSMLCTLHLKTHLAHTTKSTCQQWPFESNTLLRRLVENSSSFTNQRDRASAYGYGVELNGL